MIAPQPLRELRIMVTRPAHQAAGLCELIRSAGGSAIELPVVAIEEPGDLVRTKAVIARLVEFDLAIFVSANAAQRGMALIHEQGSLPPDLKVAAVGQRTAETLSRCGGRADVQAPPPYNSEALLASTALQDVAGKHIVIFRGEGGRELLADTLRRRGAEVDYAEVYRRVQPKPALGNLARRIEEIDIVVVTSQDGLRNLLDMAGKAQCRERLLNKRLAVFSPRIAQLATELGFTHPALVAEQASDEALINAIATWRLGEQPAQ